MFITTHNTNPIEKRCIHCGSRHKTYEKCLPSVTYSLDYKGEVKVNGK